MTGPQCGVRARSALPAEWVACLIQTLEQLDFSGSFRSHVSGHSVTLGLAAPPSGLRVATLRAQADKALILINSMFSWLCRRMGVSIAWTSLQVNRDTVADWHADSGNIGLSAILGCW